MVKRVHYKTIILLKVHQLHTYLENIIMYFFNEYSYLWELQTLLPVKCCISTPLYNSKQVGKLHRDRSRGKYFPMQTTVLPSIECKKSNEQKISVHWSRTFMTS